MLGSRQTQIPEIEGTGRKDPFLYRALLKLLAAANRALGVSGEVAMVNGVATVAMPSISDDTVILMDRCAPGSAGLVGPLYYTITAGVGFTVSSTEITENSTLRYLVLG